MVLFQALTGLAALHRLHGRDDDAAAAATEALELYRAGGFRRFRNRIDPKTDLQAAAAVCCDVLAAIAAERDEPERAATLLGRGRAPPRRRRASRSRRSSTTTSTRTERQRSPRLAR